MPKIVDRDQYRQELLSKCFELFAEKGYASITMRQIAEGLGVSTGTLYHYFPSKESLFEQLVEYLSEQDTSEQNLAQLGNPETLAERIEALFNLLAKDRDYFLKQIFIFVDFYRQQDSKEIYNSEAFEQTRERYQTTLGNYLGIQDKALVRFINNFLAGVVVEQICEGKLQGLDEQKFLLTKMLDIYFKNHSINQGKL